MTHRPFVSLGLGIVLAASAAVAAAPDPTHGRQIAFPEAGIRFQVPDRWDETIRIGPGSETCQVMDVAPGRISPIKTLALRGGRMRLRRGNSRLSVDFVLYPDDYMGSLAHPVLRGCQKRHPRASVEARDGLDIMEIPSETETPEAYSLPPPEDDPQLGASLSLLDFGTSLGEGISEALGEGLRRALNPFSRWFRHKKRPEVTRSRELIFATDAMEGRVVLSATGKDETEARERLDSLRPTLAMIKDTLRVETPVPSR